MVPVMVNGTGPFIMLLDTGATPLGDQRGGGGHRGRESGGEEHRDLAGR